ncbi:circadian clock KaiB family protein [Desulfosporosinus sp. SYSU MS00001]|uniref:circadian clock KaiB family protein n=1 Tax=Desulfosporosinus sp. SYSU MS00001 TaxID=3416284 RepID=UPI003CF62DAF
MLKRFEEQFSSASSQEYVFDLFVAGTSRRSQRAIFNVKKMCDESFKDRYKLRIIDIFQQPALAKSEQVFAVPVLVKKYPTPKRMFIGDMICSDLFKNIN